MHFIYLSCREILEIWKSLEPGFLPFSLPGNLSNIKNKSFLRGNLVKKYPGHSPEEREF